MTSRFDWDALERERRAREHGTEYAYDELPPIGSYEDRRRFLNSDPGEIVKPTEIKVPTPPTHYAWKRKPKKEDRLQNIHSTLKDLVNIPGSIKWQQKGAEYQKNILKQIQTTLNSMLRIDPAKSADPISKKALQLLSEHGSGCDKAST